MVRDGRRHIAVLATSAYASYSGCRQYRENLADALAALEAEGLALPRVDKLRHYFNHPGFLEPVIDGVLASLAELDDSVRAGAHLAFTTHSIPDAAADASGPVEDHGDGGAYVKQHLDASPDRRRRRPRAHRHRPPLAARLPVPQRRPAHPLAGAGRLRPPGRPPQGGGAAAVMVPIGFVSDHVEVLYDLDTEAAAKAAELEPAGPQVRHRGRRPAVRAAAVRELLLERAASERGRRRGALRPGRARPVPRRVPGRLLPGRSERPAAAGDRQPVRLTRTGRDRNRPLPPQAPYALARGEPVSDPRYDDQLLDDLLGVALEAARRAGALLRDGRPADLGVAATKSSPIDVVTEMDIAAEKLISGYLAEHRPDDGILGEEGGATEGSSGIRWVVDPLDGTVNYLYGLPTWAVSIAAERDGETLVGVVEAPLRGETFHAVRGRGAFLGERRLSCRPAAPLDQALVSTGFNYVAEVRTHQAEVAHRLIPGCGTSARRLRRDRPRRCRRRPPGRRYYERGLSPGTSRPAT